MTDAEFVEQTIDYVRSELDGAEGGHDWFHTQRVFRNTLLIAKDEKVNILIVSLAALLHDVADSKFHDGDEDAGPKKADAFMRKIGVPQAIRTHVVQIIRNISFKNSLEKNKKPFTSDELFVVRDADRLDAIGAIGIARAFNFGGYKGRKLYDPEIAPRVKMSKAEYKKSDGPTLNHFYEKLLLLKDRMHTDTGKRLAEKRHAFMLEYLEEFYREWNGTA
ncbi:HD domain-containing protein [Robiginitalea biformata]|uniref:Hydrolase, HAD superfamily protein n=1 Tax=Robiginitalea biformata (strain ATCC BAA-864 / DSM 15991 / KCTC 12146 / HTCC2501) TaxID=313596 RepID=A4CHJ0_ROBBH|nr:HD domain-containing protein [Robiginitalea biformata]EAR16398.1 hydrolase, HAD superfamily protein [Robiginitalea biformata HTCC2501]